MNPTFSLFLNVYSKAVVIYLNLHSKVLNVSLINAVKIKCSHNDELFAAYPATQCSTYYRCNTKGHYEEKKCAVGEKFDTVNQVCSRSADCVEPMCNNRGNGIYQDTTHGCRRYYTCFAGRVNTMDHCPPHHLHNGMKCVPEEQVMCPIKATSNRVVINTDNQLCSGHSNGIIVDPTSLDCTSYIMCDNSKVQWRRQCSKQAVFNGQQCVPSPLYQCPAASQRKTLSSHDLCYNKTDGMHANAEHGCSSFYGCLAGRLVQLDNCKSGQYFDNDSAKCIYERIGQLKHCQQLGIHTDCSNKINGYYNDGQCSSSYYYCHTGHKVLYNCRPGRTFNGQKCVSQNDYKCDKQPQNEVCLTRTDGYFKDEKDGCRAYHYCSNGNKINYLCSENHIFDVISKRCVPTLGRSSSSCPRDTFCLAKSDGYYADLRSNCHSYVYCQNGQKLIFLMCANNYVFNGQQCVPHAQYACPTLYNFANINCVPTTCLEKCARDGLFPDLTTNCRDYYICIGGKPTKSSCPIGKRFNGELCVPVDQFMCPTICNSKLRTNDPICPLKRYYSS